MVSLKWNGLSLVVQSVGMVVVVLVWNVQNVTHGVMLVEITFPKRVFHISTLLICLILKLWEKIIQITINFQYLEY